MRLVLLFALAALIACGPAVAPEPAATAAPTAAAAATPARATAAAPGPAFADLAKARQSASYKVTYRLTGTAGGQSVSGEQTWYVKPPRTRYDFSAQGAAISTFILPDGTYLCTKQAGQAFCLKQPASQALAQNQGAQADLAVSAQPEGFDAVSAGTRQIAGQAAQCYGVRAKTAQVGFAESTFCYSAQGVPLLIASKGQGFESTMEATAFSASVSDDDFKLPAPPISVP